MDRLIIQGTPEEVTLAISLLVKAYPKATVAEIIKDLLKQGE